MKRWIVLVVLGATILFSPLPAGSAKPQERFFRIQASAYQYTPAVIHANPGDRVTLELVSTDVVHGIFVDGYGLSQTADPGHPARLSFVAGRAGNFRLRCSITCGPLHPFMTGKLLVGSNTLLWRAAALALLAFAGVITSIRKRSSDHSLILDEPAH